MSVHKDPLRHARAAWSAGHEQRASAFLSSNACVRCRCTGSLRETGVYHSTTPGLYAARCIVCFHTALFGYDTLPEFDANGFVIAGNTLDWRSLTHEESESEETQ